MHGATIKIVHVLPNTTLMRMDSAPRTAFRNGND